LGEEEEEHIPIDERIEELREQGLSKSDIVLALYDEGYNTKEIMKRGFSLRHLEKRKAMVSDHDLMGAIRGGVRGVGYLEEFKDMIRHQISRSRELTEHFSNIGLGVLLASLAKSGVTMEEFRKIALDQEGLREALRRAGEAAFKALEYYQSDLIAKVEAERDEARAYASVLEATIEKMKKGLDPRLRLEKMIYNLVLLSGTTKVDPNTLSTLIDKWLRLEAVSTEAIA